MHRIDGPGHLGNHWTGGDPVTGEEPTEVTPDFQEAVQEEIANVIEATGASLNKADNTQLVSAVSSGLINPWANRLLNTQFEFWQRHGDTAFQGGSPGYLEVVGADGPEIFGADRWICQPGDTGAEARYTRDEFALGTVPAGMEAQGQPRYYLRANQTVQSISLQPRVIQRIEGVRTYAGQKIAISFVARATSGTPNIWATVRQEFGTGGSSSGFVDTLLTPAVTLSTTWTRYTRTMTLGTMSGKTIGTDGNDRLEVGFRMATGLTDEVELTDFRITPGTFTNNTILRPSEEDFALLQRYYRKSYALDVVPGTTGQLDGVSRGMALGTGGGAGQVVGSGIRYDLPMRVPMAAGVAALERATDETDGLERVWRAGITATLGSIDWNAGAHVISASAEATRKNLHTLSVAAPGFSTVEPWFFHWDADAEIVDTEV